MDTALRSNKYWNLKQQCQNMRISKVICNIHHILKFSVKVCSVVCLFVVLLSDISGRFQIPLSVCYLTDHWSHRTAHHCIALNFTVFLKHCSALYWTVLCTMHNCTKMHCSATHSTALN